MPNDSESVLVRAIAPHISCPSCKAYYAGMVYSCGNGHAVCESCYGSAALCPVKKRER